MKIKNKLFLFYFFFLGLLSCNSQNKEVESYEGYPIGVTNDYSKVELISLMGVPYYNYCLKKPKVIQSYPIKDCFRVNPEGILYGFTLAQNHIINGTMIPVGSSYNRYEEDSYFISLSKDTTIQGFPVFHKQDGFIFWTDNNVEFYNNGTIMGFGLSEDMVINGIPCNASKNNRRVMLFQNGELRHCRLSENNEIQAYPCHGGDENSELWFHPDGKLKSFVLSKDFSIDGKLYDQGTQIIFDKEGKVHFLSGQLHYVHFYENGQIHNCVLDNDIEVEGKLIEKKSRMLFYENDSLWQLKTRKEIVVDSLPCKKNKWMVFYQNGKMKWCILSKKIREMESYTKKASS